MTEPKLQSFIDEPKNCLLQSINLTELQLITFMFKFFFWNRLLNDERVKKQKKTDVKKMDINWIFITFQIPQIILLTFDGAVNINNYEHYKKVFNGKRKNPNDCDITGTFFIAHEYR